MVIDYTGDDSDLLYRSAVRAIIRCTNNIIVLHNNIVSELQVLKGVLEKEPLDPTSRKLEIAEIEKALANFLPEAKKDGSINIYRQLFNVLDKLNTHLALMVPPDKRPKISAKSLQLDDKDDFKFTCRDSVVAERFIKVSAAFERLMEVFMGQYISFFREKDERYNKLFSPTTRGIWGIVADDMEKVGERLGEIPEANKNVRYRR